MSKKEKKQRNQTIKWNLINSLMAGFIFFVGSITDGVITWKSTIIALAIAAGVAANKFQDFWKQRGKSYISKKCDGIFNFI